MPFSMMIMDADAEDSGNTNVDDVDVEDWFKFRPGRYVDDGARGEERSDKDFSERGANA